MTLSDRLRALAEALPSESSSVTLTRADLRTLVEGSGDAPVAVRDLTVQEVAQEMHRAPSTVRGWLIAGDLKGYKLNRRDWRVPRAALRAYLDAQSHDPNDRVRSSEHVDIAAWRRVRASDRRG